MGARFRSEKESWVWDSLRFSQNRGGGGGGGVGRLESLGFCNIHFIRESLSGLRQTRQVLTFGVGVCDALQGLHRLLQYS